MEVGIESEGFSAMRSRMAKAPDVYRRAASISINDNIRSARGLSVAEIRQQVAFPSSYFPGSPYQGNLRVSQTATPDNPEAILSARKQPTSLGRFIVSKDSKGRTLRARIRPGSIPKSLGNAFIVRLRRGRILDDQNFNLGVAIRLKPGQSIRGSRSARAFSNGLVLLYGPSVDQVFQSVRKDVAPGVARNTAAECIRQFQRLYRG